jgi:hypothetical protein
MADETGRDFPSSPMAHRPNPASRQSLVDKEAAWEQTLAMEILIWGEGSKLGSPELGCNGDGVRAEGCAGEGVGRLLLAWLVRSASTSELGRRY